MLGRFGTPPPPGPPMGIVFAQYPKRQDFRLYTRRLLCASVSDPAGGQNLGQYLLEHDCCVYVYPSLPLERTPWLHFGSKNSLKYFRPSPRTTPRPSKPKTRPNPRQDELFWRIFQQTKRTWKRLGAVLRRPGAKPSPK